MGEYSLQKVGDPNTGGGVIIEGHDNVFLDGQPVAIQGSLVTPHSCCPSPGCGIHCSATAAYPGSSVITINGSNVLRRTVDLDSCGHARNGDSAVFIGE